MNGADWSERYPLIVKAAARIKGSAIIDAEVVCLDAEGILMPCTAALGITRRLPAFDLLMLDSDDLWRRPLSERKAALRKVRFRIKGGIQYVEHAQGHGAEMFAAVCDLRLEHIVSKKARCPVSIWPLEKLDQGQKSEGCSAHACALAKVMRILFVNPNAN